MREKLISILREYENKPIFITGFIYELGTNWCMPEGYKIEMTEYEDSLDILLCDITDADNNVHLMYENNDDDFIITKEITDTAFVDSWVFEIEHEHFTLGFSLIEE